MTSPSENYSEPIGLTYAAHQLSSAFKNLTLLTDANNQPHASEKVAKWTNLIEKLASKQLHVGSRTPLPKTPSWVTLEVIRGGFATGKMAAGGALMPREISLLKKIRAEKGGRRALNHYYLSDEGLSQLQRWLQSGEYRISVPEEGALLTIAYLLTHDDPEAVCAILEEIEPWFDTLRFYPEPSENPIDVGSNVYLQSVEQVIEEIKSKGHNPKIKAQRESIQIWAPLYDKIVDLFLDTVDGDPPTLATDSNGKWHRTEEGKFPVVGGWPCQKYDQSWKKRAKHLLKLLAREAVLYRSRSLSYKHRGSLVRLVRYLRKCVNEPTQLSGRDVGMIRLLIACFIAKRGPPSSEKCQSYRVNQRNNIKGATFDEIGQLLISRLFDYSKDDGINNIEEIVQPVSVEESDLWKIESGTAIPETLKKRVQRTRKGTVEQLISEGLITSSEMLASFLPYITANVITAALQDMRLRRLYLTMYNAFRKRRSLLLLNYEKQVRLEEMPWIEALKSFVNNLPVNSEKSQSLDYQYLARQTMVQVVQLTLKTFPHIILPNRMVDELRALSRKAGMELPLTKELATDIFMGGFSNTYVEAAQASGKLLHDSLYESYYRINFKKINRLKTDEEKKAPSNRWKKKPTGKAVMTLGKICEARAGVEPILPSECGMIIEQQQILTTHNLAVLYQALSLENSLSSHLEDMSFRCFAFVCKQLQRDARIHHRHRHRRLINVKKSAYAWRQMIFFLSMIPSKQKQKAFLDQLDAYYNDQPKAFRDRFSTAYDGLKRAADIHCHDYVVDPKQVDIQVFTGWSAKGHWFTAKS